ncbi:MAG TPA: histidine phosphatase family protein [Ardenticatenaceae bacterium]|nr:histidine phosphatase family protein [Ardenticatenaceae bacterium]
MPTKDDALTLILVRHGQSEANAGLSADLDTVLTPLGEEQARLVGAWLNRHYASQVAGLYSSDMRRALATARTIGEVIGRESQVLPGCAEADVWLPDFLPRFEDPISAIRDPLPPLHPDYVAFEQRVREALAELIRRHPRGTVVLVSHGGVMGTIIRILFASPRLSIYTHNTGITKIRWHHGRWHLEYLNRQEHLAECEGYAV